MQTHRPWKKEGSERKRRRGRREEKRRGSDTEEKRRRRRRRRRREGAGVTEIAGLMEDSTIPDQAQGMGI
jgi:hypothetical protein